MTEKTSTPNEKTTHRYKLLPKPNTIKYAVLDMKNNQKVTDYLSKEEAEARKRVLIKLAVSEEENRGGE